MVSMGNEDFRISSRGWTPRGHRIWAVFDIHHFNQVAVIAVKPIDHTLNRHGRYKADEFVRCINVVDRLPWEPYDPDDPLQLEIMKRRYPKES